MNTDCGGGGPRHFCGTLTLVAVALALAGCCGVTPKPADAGGQVLNEVGVTDAIPILVTLTADEGEALAAARTRVLARLRSVMSEDAFAAVRVYEALPVIALPARPELLALILTFSDVRSVEADRRLEFL